MEKIAFEQLQEELFYEKLDNGLDVYILPKQEFNKTFATFTTNFGSIDNTFKGVGTDQFKRVPDGIAHFLEHKLFEKEDGDVFQQFSKQGASANAFTTFTRTAYLFSSTSDVPINLETLLDFVQEPYFSEKTVEKEKGIIGQEIRMYEDNADWRLYFGVIENMYENHPVKIDIAGTVESIAEITKDLLYECYYKFYHPSNMLLFVIGPVEPKKIMDQIKENQSKKSFDKQGEIERAFVAEKDSVATKKRVIKMNIQSPKCVIGIKDISKVQSGKEAQRKELTINLFLDMVFGKSSPIYDEMYAEGLIDSTFFYDYSLERGFGFSAMGGDTPNPDLLESRLYAILQDVKNGSILTEENMIKTKKKKIGSFLRSLNSPEFIANQFTRYAFNEMNLFDVVPILEEITFEEVKKAATALIEDNRMTTLQILSQK